jgi:hypothetical protein
VNVFVLISGWFGIKCKVVRLLSLLFQTVFFATIIYVVLVICDSHRYLNFDSFSTIFFFHSNDYWFIKAYIGLYIFSPLINAYIETTSKQQLEKFLILFFVFQTIYGWLNLFGAHWFEGGFSMISFIGLYVLARYVRMYVNLNRSMGFYLSIYLVIGLGLGLLSLLLAFLGIPIFGRLLTYTNPLVIIMSLALLLSFSKLRFQNIFVNKMASSCLAIYLLHANELLLRPYYFAGVENISNTHIGIVVLLLDVLWIIMWALGGIVLDSLRKLSWSAVENHFFVQKDSNIQ